MGETLPGEERHAPGSAGYHPCPRRKKDVSVPAGPVRCGLLREQAHRPPRSGRGQRDQPRWRPGAGGREANLLCGLRKYANDESRKRQSIPKFSVYNNALLTAYRGKGFEHDFIDPMLWGTKTLLAMV